MITTWYLHSQRTWDKLCHSCIGSSFLPRGAFPEGRAYAFSQRLHAGSLEALWGSRPEAVVLAVNKALREVVQHWSDVRYRDRSGRGWSGRRRSGGQGLASPKSPLGDDFVEC